MTSMDAVYFEKSDLMFYEDRLNTFKHWPKQLLPDKYRLAQAGFCSKNEGDKVTCFACGLNLNDWERADDPWVEHEKWSSNCIYLKIVGVKPRDIPSNIFIGKPFKPSDTFSFNYRT